MCSITKLTLTITPYSSPLLTMRALNLINSCTQNSETTKNVTVFSTCARAHGGFPWRCSHLSPAVTLRLLKQKSLTCFA